MVDAERGANLQNKGKMRRARTSSRDSSQDSPGTDNERDIIWGDSPPPRRICLSTTPGRRVTRASAAEQDLTDLMGCMHPKENKESSTPPLLGLWMRNRQEPDSGKKKHRPARLARRATGRKLSRIGLDKTVLDDLRILTEWTGNLATTVEEPACHPEKIDGDVRTEGTDLDGGGDCEAMECEDLEDLFADDDSATDDKMETRQAMKERRKSSNLSFSDDLWDNDDWYDDDSIIRIATQVENEALTQLMQQKKGKIESPKSDVDMISPTQTGSVVNAKSKMCQNVNQTKTSICIGVQSSNTGHSMQTLPPVSRVITHSMDSSSSMTRGSKAVSMRTWTTQSTTQATVSKITSRSSQMVSQKPASTSYRKAPMFVSRSNNVPSVNSKAVSTASIPSTSTHYTATSVSGAKPLVAKNSLYTNANMSVSSRTAQKAPGKASCTSSTSKLTSNGAHSGQLSTNKLNTGIRAHPVMQSASSAIQAGNHPTTDTRVSQKIARVPPMTDAIANRNSTSAKGPVFNDSLDDLFAGDNSLPDDMLLALLDNDSDFEEYTKKVPSTVPVVPNNSTEKQLLGHSKQESLPSERNTGNSATSTTPTHPMSTRAQYSSGASLKAKGNNTCRTNKYSSRSSTPQNQHPTINTQSTLATRSRLTRSTVQNPACPPVSNQHVHHVGGKSGQDRKSLSQPVPPSAKEGGVSTQRCCSQQEIEQKRQAALAKRKNSQRRVSPT